MEEEVVKVTMPPCTFCGKQATVNLPLKGFQKWQLGAYVQDAFPGMPVDVRELLISGTCSRCWDKHMREPDDE